MVQGKISKQLNDTDVLLWLTASHLWLKCTPGEIVQGTRTQFLIIRCYTIMAHNREQYFETSQSTVTCQLEDVLLCLIWYFETE